MEKFIKDGNVAVLYSPGYGAGWSTWNDQKEAMCMDSRLVQCVIDEDFNKLLEVAEEICPGGYFGGAALRIEWLPIGTVFEVSEYDGNEDVRVISHTDFFVA